MKVCCSPSCTDRSVFAALTLGRLYTRGTLCLFPECLKRCFYVPQCLTGGSNGGVHCTDVTNASRTMLFNIHTMEWDPELCKSASILFPVTKCHCMLVFLTHSPLLLYFLGTLMSRWKSSPKSGAPLKYTAGWWELLTYTGFRDSVCIRLIWRLWPTCIFNQFKRLISLMAIELYDCVAK